MTRKLGDQITNSPILSRARKRFESNAKVTVAAAPPPAEPSANNTSKSSLFSFLTSAIPTWRNRQNSKKNNYSKNMFLGEPILLFNELNMNHLPDLRPTRSRSMRDGITIPKEKSQLVHLKRHLGARKRGKVSRNFRKKNNNNSSSLSIKRMTELLSYLSRRSLPLIVRQMALNHPMTFL